jgi:hypothetical protein
MDGVGAKRFYVRMLKSQNVGCWYFGSRGKETERFVSPVGRHRGYWWLGDVVGQTTMTADHNRIPSKSLTFSTPEGYRYLFPQVSPLFVCSVRLIMSLFLCVHFVDVLFDCGRLKFLHWPLAVDLGRWNRLLKITSVAVSILSSYSYLYLTARTFTTTSVVWSLIETKIFTVQI